jgi:hypothetical protein
MAELVARQQTDTKIGYLGYLNLGCTNLEKFFHFCWLATEFKIGVNSYLIYNKKQFKNHENLYMQ